MMVSIIKNISKMAHVINPPPCLQAPLECTDVEKLFLEESVILFKGSSPRRAAYTRKPPQTISRLFFLMSKNQAQKLQNGSLGDPKIIKKTRKWGPEWNVEQIGKNTEK